MGKISIDTVFRPIRTQMGKKYRQRCILLQSISDCTKLKVGVFRWITGPPINRSLGS